MLTMREAQQRAAVNNGRIVRDRETGELRCTLNEWRGAQVEKLAYYTDCLLDAVMTVAAMRRGIAA